MLHNAWVQHQIAAISMTHRCLEKCTTISMVIRLAFVSTSGEAFGSRANSAESLPGRSLIPSPSGVSRTPPDLQNEGRRSHKSVRLCFGGGPAPTPSNLHCRSHGRHATASRGRLMHRWTPCSTRVAVAHTQVPVSWVPMRASSSLSPLLWPPRQVQSPQCGAAIQSP